MKTFQFPCYELLHEGDLYNINVLSGYVSIGDKTYMSIPFDLLQHPVIERLGFDSSHGCFIKDDLIILKKSGEKFYVIKYGDLIFNISREFVSNDSKVMLYQLCPVSTEQAKYLNYHPGIDFPEIISSHSAIGERDSLAWIRQDQAEIRITTGSGKINHLLLGSVTNEYINERVPHELHKGKYQTRRTLGKIIDWTIHDAYTDGALCHFESYLNQCLAEFESNKFIYVYCISKHKFRIVLPRYGLVLYTNGSNWKHILLKMNSVDYVLDQRSNPFDDNIACLTFISEKRKFCIVAVQDFIDTKQRSSYNEYNLVTHDIINHNRKKIVEDALRNTNKSIPDIWQYTDTENFIQYKIVEGRPIADKAEDALYLCFIYISNNDISMAWDVLLDTEKRLGGLDGTFNEMLYIAQIIGSPIVNPETVSVKLKTLYLLTCCLNKNIDIELPNLIVHPENNNQYYYNARVKLARGTITLLTNNIEMLLSNYNAMSRDRLTRYDLTGVEKLVLLEKYFSQKIKNERPNYQGVLGYQIVSLLLQNLNEEKNRIFLKSDLDEYDRKRLIQIDKSMAVMPIVTMPETCIEDADITYKYPLPDTASVNDIMTQVFDSEDSSKWKISWKRVTADDMQKAISALDEGINNKSVFDHLPALFYIAISHPRSETDPVHAHRSKLKCKCRHVLLSRPPLKQFYYLIINTLYRFIVDIKWIATIKTNSVVRLIETARSFTIDIEKKYSITKFVDHDKKISGQHLILSDATISAHDVTKERNDTVLSDKPDISPVFSLQMLLALKTKWDSINLTTLFVLIVAIHLISTINLYKVLMIR